MKIKKQKIICTNEGKANEIFTFENINKDCKKVKIFFSAILLIFLAGVIILSLTSCKEEAKPTKDNQPSLIEVYRHDTNNLKAFIYKQHKLF